MKKVKKISEIKEGNYIIRDGEAYRVTKMQHSKAGKHGHGKYRVNAVSLIGHKKVSFVMGSGHNIDVPIIDKRSAQVLTIDERTETIDNREVVKKTANVMDTETYETFNLEVPEDLKDEVKENDKIVYWEFLGNKVMKQVT